MAGFSAFGVWSRNFLGDLLALRECPVAGLVADVTRSRVTLELGRAAAGKARTVRIEAAANAARAMATCAVTFDVAAHTRIEIALRFEGMVIGFSRRVAPLALLGVESTAVAKIGRATHRYARALVAVDAERLLAMAARASLRCLARLDCVHVQVVVRVNAARPNASVVAICAVLLRVALRAYLRVRARNLFVPFDKVGRMAGVV